VLMRNVEDKNLQLGLIAMFMALFAISVAALTNARRVEVFTATAAYAAVLTVFVSSSPGASGVAGTGCVCGVNPLRVLGHFPVTLVAGRH